MTHLSNTPILKDPFHVVQKNCHPNQTGRHPVWKAMNESSF